jgi:hypothetical protein
VSKRARSHRALFGDDRIRSACDQMLEANEKLTARAVARRAGIGAASSITRDPVRRAMLEGFQREQDKRNDWVKRAKKQSLAKTENQLNRQAITISQFEQLLQLLVASHKAVLMGIDAVGGTREWLRFFRSYRDGILVEALRVVGAIPEPLSLPEAERLIGRKPTTNGKDRN